MNFLGTIRGPAGALAFACAFAFALVAATGGPARARATKAPDDALDSLLEKLSGGGDKGPDSTGPSRKSDAGRKADAGEKSKPTDDKKPDAARKPGASSDKADAKPQSDVGGKDQELDELLEKLGGTRDEPSPDDRPRGGPGGAKNDDRPAPGPGPKPKTNDKPDDAARSKLSDKEKQTDEHLEELTGRRRKRRGDDGQRGGKVGEIIKEMRDVEGKLTKPDTGESTRNEQKKIVRNIDTLIEEARRSGGSALGRRVVRYVRRPGQRPDGHQPGATGQGVGPMKPARPPEKHAVVGGKDIWGHLPPELRQQIENQAHEEPLVSKQSLIDRYYLSVGKGKLVREE